jgi:hypothetical protein
VSDSSFYGNRCYLDLSVPTTNYTGSFPFRFSPGIAAVNGAYYTNLYFYNYTFTVLATNSVTPAYGIAFNDLWLDANLDNFTNNFFTNFAGWEVYADGYPISSNVYPNDLSGSLLDSYIGQSNSFH